MKQGLRVGKRLIPALGMRIERAARFFRVVQRPREFANLVPLIESSLCIGRFCFQRRLVDFEPEAFGALAIREQSGF